jgi:hypothetical protein
MSRDEQTICGEIKTMIAFVIRSVARKDTPDRSRGVFVGCDGHIVRVTHATKDM